MIQSILRQLWLAITIMKSLISTKFIISSSEMIQSFSCVFILVTIHPHNLHRINVLGDSDNIFHAGCHWMDALNERRRQIHGAQIKIRSRPHASQYLTHPYEWYNVANHPKHHQHHPKGISQKPDSSDWETWVSNVSYSSSSCISSSRLSWERPTTHGRHCDFRAK